MNSKSLCRLLSLVLGVVGFSDIGLAADLGFRYLNGKCLNQSGVEGLNTSYFGQCSDFRGTVLGGIDFSKMDLSGSRFDGANVQKVNFTQTKLEGVHFSGAILDGSDFIDTELKGVNFAKASLKNVSFAESRLVKVIFDEAKFKGNQLSGLTCQECSFKKTNLSDNVLDHAQLELADFTGAVLKNVNFTEAKLIAAKLSQVDLSGATLVKTMFVRADLSKADLSNANLKSADFSEANMLQANLIGVSAPTTLFKKVQLNKANLKRANFRGANFESSNLEETLMLGSDFRDTNLEMSLIKGAVHSQRTQLPFSKEKADSLGMVFKKISRVLLLVDQDKNFYVELSKAFANEDIELVISAKLENEFIGTELKQGFDAVIHLNANTYNVEMAEVGQIALVDFVQKGGVYIHSLWHNYEIMNLNKMQKLKDLSLLTYNDSRFQNNTVMVGVSANFQNHPLTDLLPKQFKIMGTGGDFDLVPFANNPSVTLVENTVNKKPIMAMRKFGAGTVIGFNFQCAQNNLKCFADSNVQRMYINAVQFQ